MPLPLTGAQWPPAAHTTIQKQLCTWDAWFTGDRDRLADVYGGTTTASHYRGAVPYKGGLAGAVSRMFWGQPLAPGQERPKLHIPAAGDIASTSAGLLFDDPPSITVENPDRDKATQARLDELFDEHMWIKLVDAAEICAGLGGVFLRVAWEKDTHDRPLVSVIGPDLATPKFRWDKLTEVTFTWTLDGGADDEQYRHLELHTVGKVEHGLYLGDKGNLGRRIPLTEHPDTSGLAELVDEASAVATGLDRLDVVYLPNETARRWRKDPVGSHLGQPDICGVEPLLDALDEAWTSWMRDIRLGKARAVVPQAFLESNGPGQGASFDLDQELFTGVNALSQPGEMPIQLIQAAIRHQEHAATCTALFERCIDGAGYSAQTFGLTGEVSMTATESNARERKTNRTRKLKTRHWAPGLADFAELLLEADVLVYSTEGVVPSRPTVEFPPLAQDPIETRARTVQMIDAARAASTAEKVRMLHPDWDTKQVDAEVALIKDEESTLTPVDPYNPTDPGGLQPPPGAPGMTGDHPNPAAG